MVVDIDGTLSEVGPRRRLLEESPVDWEAFYEDEFDDPPKRNVCSFVSYAARRLEVIFCTSRRESERLKTQRWIARHLGLVSGGYRLIMRENGDVRPAVVQKWDQFRKETTEEERGRVLFILDDDKTVAHMWRRRGFVCFEVK